jgi:hypothetical protein
MPRSYYMKQMKTLKPDTNTNKRTEFDLRLGVSPVNTCPV